MSVIIFESSHTFDEFLLVPRLTTKECIPKNVNLKVPLVAYNEGETPSLYLNMPTVSAIMQSVSGVKMAIALAKYGGLSFIYASQKIEDQAAMVSSVKKYKAGFVVSDSNLTPNSTLNDVIQLQSTNGHSTIPITEDGTSNGKLLGLVTSRDYRLGHTKNETPVSEFMTKIENLICGKEGIDLPKANAMVYNNKLNVLPIVDDTGNLKSLVFRKDYHMHESNKNELLDIKKRFMVGAGVNTVDYRQRIPALVNAGADILCIDASDGFSEWQSDVIKFVRTEYGDSVKIGAGNIVNAEAFNYLVDSGADFIKVGIGGGSICITREQKGIGCGQATAIIEVAAARDEYFKKNKRYVPICSDGGIVMDNHVLLALSMGADFVMMGRFFAKCDEAPGEKLQKNGAFFKEYWGEGSNKARNWQRYDSGEKASGLKFEEGVDSYVPYAGSVTDNLDILTAKLKSTMCNCGVISIDELHKNAIIRLVSDITIHEGGAHDVIIKE